MNFLMVTSNPLWARITLRIFEGKGNQDIHGYTDLNGLKIAKGTLAGASGRSAKHWVIREVHTESAEGKINILK